jgi:hypothetical protein
MRWLSSWSYCFSGSWELWAEVFDLWKLILSLQLRTEIFALLPRAPLFSTFVVAIPVSIVTRAFRFV